MLFFSRCTSVNLHKIALIGLNFCLELLPVICCLAVPGRSWIFYVLYYFSRDFPLSVSLLNPTTTAPLYFILLSLDIRKTMPFCLGNTVARICASSSVILCYACFGFLYRHSRNERHTFLQIKSCIWFLNAFPQSGLQLNKYEWIKIKNN